MKYDVVIKRKVAKGLRKLPPNSIAIWERLGWLAGGIRAGQ